jgi:hypothetical protein
MTEKYIVEVEELPSGNVRCTLEDTPLKYKGKAIGKITGIKCDDDKNMYTTIILNNPINYIKLGPFSIETKPDE